ncbi:MAG: thiamine diphosphokinase, partial [Ruminococcus sp.]|nr:thiamine diphosphokinase [Ruminococcus sp.]
MNRCFIFGALPVSSLTETPEKGDYIIAADKGYDVALSLGLTPDLVVGDFDSLGSAPDAENVVRLQVRNDDTDVGHAVGMGFERG